ncbi:hypothetical protein [Hymenobacter nivis]|uniref:Uncharacterized protein n=1 Tax=Hymenobacter nivis TaxID=1850093 RepID=A0A2Z3GHQ1_9BACT|nr:hypothetical protein [Hymenobacter nivis]AWM31322.1 hypothetical protein DDQ68_00090 [Hymenobacter nivis]
MHLYLPRRHRRPLLFPPGLLALAGLLWLGCVALGPWQERLKVPSVIQLTMFPLHVSPNSFWAGNPLLLSVQKRNVFRPWRNALFTGNSQTDSTEQIFVIKQVRYILADSSHDGGVRIRFAPTARYKELVFIFDLMNRENVRQYWLDVVHTPAILYAFTKKYKPVKYEHFPCLLCNDVIPYAPPPPTPAPFWVRFDNWVTDFWHLTWLRPLLQPEWRASVWLLAAIVALGGWRVVGPRRATQMP